jgi:hypothetical protein
MLESRTISIAIRCPYERAYAFASVPENFPKWAAGLSSGLRRAGGQWIGETPAGDAVIRFSPPNEFGVLDHHVLLPGKPEIYVPLRMIANGEGTEVTFTLFRQADMEEADWSRDEALVREDLDALRRLLETS